MIASGTLPAVSPWLNQSASSFGRMIVVRKTVEGREVESRVHTTAATLFKNIAGAFLMVGAVASFVAVPFTLEVVAMISVLAMAPLALEVFSSQRGGDSVPLDGERKIGHYILGASAATGGSGILAHELGHASAARATFVGASPRVYIRPFHGGSTTFSTAGSLTAFGKLLGLRGSLTFIAAAGMMGTLLTATIALVVARRIEKYASAVADFLNGHAVAQVLNELVYVLSVFSAKPDDFGHDYVRLWKASAIHPVLPIAVLVLIPTIQLIAAKRLWRATANPEQKF